MDDGLITICIPTYRRPSMLLHAFASALTQDYRPLEIDVSDDSPSHDSEVLLTSMPEPEGITVRYRRNVPSLGQAANVTSLFAQARGTRLVLLHDDDTLLPGAIRSLDEAWRATPDIIAAYGIQQVIRENGEVSIVDTQRHNDRHHRVAEDTGVHSEIVERVLWQQFPNNGYLVETAAAQAIGVRSFGEIGNSADADFSIRLALENRGRTFAFIDRETSQYRLNREGIRSTTLDSNRRLYAFLRGISGLSVREERARQEFLRKIAVTATVENALHGKRGAALRIFFSPFYPRRRHPLKTLYVLLNIAVPRLASVREVWRKYKRFRNPDTYDESSTVDRGRLLRAKSAEKRSDIVPGQE
jgi:glycosyltransferase involved in cell wall biosynthesis